MARVVPQAIDSGNSRIAVIHRTIQLIQDRFFRRLTGNFRGVRVLALIIAAGVVNFASFPNNHRTVRHTNIVFRVRPIASLLPITVCQRQFAHRHIRSRRQSRFFQGIMEAMIVQTINSRHQRAMNPRPNTRRVITANF